MMTMAKPNCINSLHFLLRPPRAAGVVRRRVRPFHDDTKCRLGRAAPGPKWTCCDPYNHHYINRSFLWVAPRAYTRREHGNSFSIIKQRRRFLSTNSPPGAEKEGKSSSSSGVVNNNNSSESGRNDELSNKGQDDNKRKLDKETLHRIISFSQPEHSLIGWSAATLFVTSSTTLILPTASGKVLDMVVGGDPTVSPTLVAFGLFGLTAAAGTGVYARTLWLQQAGNTMVARLKQRLFGSILGQEVAYFDQVRTGDLMTRLSQDTQMIQAAVTTQAVSALRAIVMSAGSTIMLFQTSTTLALVSLGTLPPLFLAARSVGRTVREKQTEVQTLHSHATSLAEESLNGIQTVVQFGAESHELDRYSQAVTKAHDKAISTGKTQAIFDGAVHVGANGAILCVLGYGGSMVMSGTITAGDLTGFLMYSLLLAGNVSSLSGTYSEVMKAVAAADRVFEVMDRTPSIPSGLHARDDAVATFQHPLSVEFRNIHFAYPARRDKTILGPNFSLRIQPGEVMAIVGGSGSGKSTLARLLTRLYDIDIVKGPSYDLDSAILVNDRDIRDWDPNELRRGVIGIVSQEALLFSGTIEDNIRYGRPSATHSEVLEAAELANVTEFTSHFSEGLQTKVGPRGTQLSGGQKQRVAIARLILKDPPVVVFDEATSALDARSEHYVQKALDSVMYGRTVISIAHRLSTIRGADRIAVLQDGVVAEVGTFEELSNSQDGAFRSLMGRQLITAI